LQRAVAQRDDHWLPAIVPALVHIRTFASKWQLVAGSVMFWAIFCWRKPAGGAAIDEGVSQIVVFCRIRKKCYAENKAVRNIPGLMQS
jgi:hypothetical protein